MCVEVYRKFVLRFLLYVRFGGVFELTKIVVIVLANAVHEHFRFVFRFCYLALMKKIYFLFRYINVQLSILIVFMFLTDSDFCPVFRL